MIFLSRKSPLRFRFVESKEIALIANKY